MLTANNYRPNLTIFRKMVSALDSVMTRSKMAFNTGVTHRQLNYYLCGRTPVPFTVHFYFLAVLKKYRLTEQIPGL